MVARLRMLLGLQYSLAEFFWHLCISHHITVILSSSPINTTRTVEVFDKISSKSESRHYNENNWYQSSNRNPKSLFLINQKFNFLHWFSRFSPFVQSFIGFSHVKQHSIKSNCNQHNFNQTFIQHKSCQVPTEPPSVIKITVF